MKRILFSFFLLLLVASCGKKNDPTPATPAPSANFTVARSVAEVNEPVALTNASLNATRYEWHSSDNPTNITTSANPVASFAQPGTYVITLAAYNADGKVSSMTQTIRIGRRYLKAVSITAMSFIRPDGKPWRSNGTSPDVYFGLLKPDGSVGGNGAPITNVQPANLPLSWQVPTTTNLEVVNGNWNMFVFDLNGNNPTTMLDTKVPVTAPPANRDTNGNGSYTYQIGGWAFTYLIETR